MRTKIVARACSLAAFTLLTVAVAQAEEAKRLFTVRDAIEATRPLNPSINAPTPAGRVPVVSPDGRRFLTLTERGVLDTNENEYRLQLFKVTSAESPRIDLAELATLRTIGNWPAIADPAWVGSDRIAFLGAEARGTPQVYFAHVHDGLQRRTAEPVGVRSFATNLAGDLIYLTLPISDPQVIADALESGYVVGRHLTALDLYTERWKERAVAQRAVLFHMPAGAQSPTQLRSIEIGSNASRLVRLWMSPDGRQAVVLQPTADYLKQWEGYDYPELKEYVTRGRSYKPGTRVPGAFPFPQYFLVDLVTHDYRPLVIAPAWVWQYALQPQVVWSPDGRSILLVDCMFPMASVTGLSSRERGLALRHPAVLEVDLQDGHIRPVWFVEDRNLQLTPPVWSANGRRIEVNARDEVTGDTKRLVFEREGRAWRQSGVTAIKDREVRAGFAALLDGRLEAGVEQGINLPPQVVVRKRGSNTPLYALPLNPQFTDVQLSPMRTISWTDDSGSVWSGGLMYPAHYTPGKRYPLVIQTHGYNPDEFLFDSMMFVGDRPGAFTGMSARALSAKGFFVVQEYAENTHAWPRYNTSDEGPQFVRSYRALIAMLEKQGVVDPIKVGLIGFSRTCYHVKYVLAHADFTIGAAAIADGWDFGYFQMMLADETHKAVKVYGTRPVGDGLLAWLRDAPTFNADRFRAPLRIEAIDPISVGAEYEMFAALKLVDVPTELTVYPDGVHRLSKPRERYRSQQANIDWLGFWINGEEDPDPVKREQYERWRALREAWPRTAEDSSVAHSNLH